MPSSFDLHPSKQTGCIDIQRVLVFHVPAARLAGYAAEDRIGIDLDIQVFRHVNVNAPEDCRCMNRTVAVNQRAAQIAFDAAEDGVELRTLENLAGIIQRRAGEDRRAAWDRGVILPQPRVDLLAPVSPNTAQNQLSPFSMYSRRRTL